MAAKVKNELCAKTDSGVFVSLFPGLAGSRGGVPVRRGPATLLTGKCTREVARDVRAFSAEAELSADLSVMAARWRGPTNAVTPS